MEAGLVVDARCGYNRPPFASLEIERVDAVLVRKLTRADARRQGLETVEQLREEVRRLYPRTDALVRIRFRLLSDNSAPVSAAATSSSSIASPT